MARFRVSIAGILGLVGVVSIVFAAIRVGSPAWAGLFLSIMYFALIASWMGIVFRRGSRRVFWIGFALLGWSYLFLSRPYWFGTSIPIGETDVGQHLLAPQIVPQLYDLLHSQDGLGYAEQHANWGEASGAMGAGMGGMGGGGMGGGMRSMMGGMGGPGAATPPSVFPGDFLRIFRCLEALLWAYLGGWTARYFASGRLVPTETPVAP